MKSGISIPMGDVSNSVLDYNFDNNDILDAMTVDDPEMFCTACDSRKPYYTYADCAELLLVQCGIDVSASDWFTLSAKERSAEIISAINKADRNDANYTANKVLLSDALFLLYADFIKDIGNMHDKGKRENFVFVMAFKNIVKEWMDSDKHEEDIHSFIIKNLSKAVSGLSDSSLVT